MNCVICKERLGFDFYYIKELMYGTCETFKYIECTSCGCLQIEKVPENMSIYYEDSYYSFNVKQKPSSGWKKILVKVRDKFSIKKKGLMGRLLYAFSPNESLEMLSRFNLSEKSRILDVGCGTGWLLHSLKNIGFSHVVGVDPNIKEEIVYENGLRIYKKNIFEVDGTWDLIMFNHSFEHMSNPNKIVEKVRSLLVGGGFCYILAPTVSSFAWSYYKEYWVQVDAPRHLFIPSVNSIKTLADNNGFVLVDTIYNSTYLQFIGSEQYKKGIPLTDERSYFVDPKKSIFTKKDVVEFKKKANKLNNENFGDQAVFIMKKI